jgi:protein TonB
MTRREGYDSTRWASSIACALLLHAGLATVLLLDFGTALPEPVAPPVAAMMVELSSLPATPEQQLTQMPPGPEQIEAPAEPKPKPMPRAFDPPPEVKSIPPPDALATKSEEEFADQQAAADRTTAAPSSLAPTSEALQAPVEGVPSDRATAAIQTWENRLLTHLERHKRYPGAAQRRRQEDLIYLRFTMDRTGKVMQSTIWRSRGYPLLDAEVNALIQRASPLPPPPAEMTGGTIEMIVPVEFFLRRQLAQEQRR